MAKRELFYGTYQPIPRGDPQYSSTKRLYRDHSGTIIPKSQFDKLAHAARQTIIPSRATRAERQAVATRSTHAPSFHLSEPRSKHLDYQDKVKAFAREQGIGYNEARKDASFKVAYREYRSQLNKLETIHHNPKLSPDEKKAQRHYITRAHGPLAQSLEDMGLREVGTEYAVGDTPARK
jgi:hypothetical protein